MSTENRPQFCSSDIPVARDAQRDFCPGAIERLADRFRGALLGVAIGDALGAPLEGGSMRNRASLATWLSEPPHPLRYTDDTHMTLATATSLVFHYQNPKRAAEVARAAAQITLAHPVGRDGAGLAAAAVAEILNLPPDEGLEPRRLVARLRDHASTRRFRDLLDRAESLGDADECTVVQVLGNGIEAHRSVATALYAFLRHHDSFQDAILFALSLGGDADTIASMTGAFAGAAHGASAMPGPWAERVEGREELLTLADQLLDLALDDAVSTSSTR